MADEKLFKLRIWRPFEVTTFDPERPPLCVVFIAASATPWLGDAAIHVVDVVKAQHPEYERFRVRVKRGDPWDTWDIYLFNGSGQERQEKTRALLPDNNPTRAENRPLADGDIWCGWMPHVGEQLFAAGDEVKADPMRGTWGIIDELQGQPGRVLVDVTHQGPGSEQRQVPVRRAQDAKVVRVHVHRLKLVTRHPEGVPFDPGLCFNDGGFAKRYPWIPDCPDTVRCTLSTDPAQRDADDEDDEEDYS